MRDVLRQLHETLAQGRRSAYCRLVETRGSTPQKAGAAMLVHADGSQVGTLGGGCVEAEVKRRALAILENGRAEVVSFQLDSDYGWDDGLICGGRMKVLIDPLTEPSSIDYFRHLHELVEAGAGLIEAIVFDGDKLGLPTAASFLFDGQGQLAARLGVADDTPLGALTEMLPELDSRPRAQAAHGVAILPVLPRTKLLIVGGGHVGHAVGQLAPDLDFDVTVVDDRGSYVSAERFPRAVGRVAGEIGDALRDFPVDAHTYCLIVTRGHNHDEEALYHLANRGARYVGMIGSRRKIKLIFDDLASQGMPREALAEVHAPVGIDIGSQTVHEIAVSILAELVSHRNRNGHVPGRPDGVLVSHTAASDL